MHDIYQRYKNMNCVSKENKICCKYLGLKLLGIIPKLKIKKKVINDFVWLGCNNIGLRRITNFSAVRDESKLIYL